MDSMSFASTCANNTNGAESNISPYHRHRLFGCTGAPASQISCRLATEPATALAQQPASGPAQQPASGPAQQPVLAPALQQVWAPGQLNHHPLAPTLLALEPAPLATVAQRRKLD